MTTTSTSEAVYSPIVNLSIWRIDPSPENQQLYKPVAPDDDATLALADSIKKFGIIDPLIVSADGYIISGHRRHVAARIAGLEKVPCRRRLDVRRGDGKKADAKFLELLSACNSQRIKTRDELLRERVIAINPDEAPRALPAYRRKKAKIDNVEAIEIREAKQRCEISPAKFEFLNSIKKTIEELREYCPISLRHIHYQLINDPPLKHASKPDSRYRNDKSSNDALIDLATRARHADEIDYDVIADPTRPTTIWNVHNNLSSYYKQQTEDILSGYDRDLMQSQPIHIEIVAEKLTVQNIVEPVACKFCIPLTIGRGQCSTRPLYDISQRFRKSGKEKLVILAMNDLDPDGDEIAHSIARRLRDDFNIDSVEVIKAALTMEQARALYLPESFERAKTGSTNYQRYFDTYCTDCVWELEALDPGVLQRLLTEHIDSVIDRIAFNHEVAEQRKDSAHNADVRKIVLKTLNEQTLAYQSS